MWYRAGRPNQETMGLGPLALYYDNSPFTTCRQEARMIFNPNYRGLGLAGSFATGQRARIEARLSSTALVRTRRLLPNAFCPWALSPSAPYLPRGFPFSSGKSMQGPKP